MRRFVASGLLLFLFLILTPLSRSEEPPIPQEMLEAISARAGGGPVLIGDTSGGVIRYFLPQAAKVRIFICARGGTRRNVRSLRCPVGKTSFESAPLVLRTLIDWEKRPAGLNKELWDGQDTRGNLINPHGYLLRINLRPLPEDTLVAEGEFWRHKKHHPAKCHSLKIKIVSPKPGSTISGSVLVKVELDRRYRGYSDEIGNSLRAHLNHHPQYFKEIPFLRGRDTFTWQWDTTTVPNGKHLFTINVCDYNDHIGVDTIRVFVQNGGNAP